LSVTSKLPNHVPVLKEEINVLGSTLLCPSVLVNVELPSWRSHPISSGTKIEIGPSIEPKNRGSYSRVMVLPVKPGSLEISFAVNVNVTGPDGGTGAIPACTLFSAERRKALITTTKDIRSGVIRLFRGFPTTIILSRLRAHDANPSSIPFLNSSA
jgi:hypothetical protein